MSVSPTPTKHPRFEWDSLKIAKKDVVCNEKNGYQRDPLLDDGLVQIKSEPVDDLFDFSLKCKQEKAVSPPLAHKPSKSGKSPKDFISSADGKLMKCDSGIESSEKSKHAEKSFRGSGGPHSQYPDSKSGVFHVSDGASEVNGEHAEPDSSTGTCEQLMREGGRRPSVSGLNLMDDLPNSSQPNSSSGSVDPVLCQVCGDTAAGFYCGAYICEACKKFFIRASKLEKPRYVCLRQKNCVITKESRVHCQYCRYQKCLQLNMYYPKDGQKHQNSVGIQEIPCRVCSAPSSGFHFGALTCEGCKGFFRRMVKEREAYSYKCTKSGTCEVNAMTRNMCKACRYNKCLQIGMSVEGSRIGRQPNAVKHAISLEAKKQAALKTEPGSNTGEGQLETSPSNFNFDSVILDPCLPGDVDDSLQSIEISQEASPESAQTSSRHGEIKGRQDTSSNHTSSNVKLVPEDSGPSLSTPSPSVLQPTYPHPADMFRLSHHTKLSMPSELYRNIPEQLFPSSLSSSVSSLSRSPNMSVFTTPRTEFRVSPSQMEPQDLSIDFSSSPQVSSASSSYSASHHSAPSPIPFHPPNTSSSLGPTSVPPPTSPQHFPSSYSPEVHNASGRISHQHIYRSLDGEVIAHHKPGYYYPVGTSQTFVSSTHNPHYSRPCSADDHDRHISSHIRQRSESVSPLPHPAFSAYSRHAGSMYEHHAMRHYNSEVNPDQLHLHQQFAKESNTVNSTMMSQHYRNQHNYFPSPRREEQYTAVTSQENYPDGTTWHHRQTPELDSPQPHNLIINHEKRESSPFNYVPPRRDNCPSSPIPDKGKYSHSQTPEHRPSPASTPTSGRPVCAPSPLSISDVNIMKASDSDLTAIILEAAKNLKHLSLVDRAKSGIFHKASFLDVDSTWERMMEQFNFHAKCIVRFAKRVPGFRALKLDDQVLLLRMATYSLVILNHSRAYETDTGFYNYFNFSQPERERIMELFPEFDILHTHYKHTGIMAKNHALTEKEYAFLSCMILLNDEHPGLEDVLQVRELKERYTDVFLNYEMEQFANGSLRFGEMLLRLSEFSHISMQHNLAVGLVITKNSQLHIPQLYAEMYTNNQTADGGSPSESS